MKFLTTELREGIAFVRAEHGKANALDLEFCHAVADEFERLAKDTRAAVLIGAGHIFSAGVDLVRLSDEKEAYTRKFLPALDRLLLTLFQFPRPLVAAINGHAIGGGCILACTADYRLMAEGPFRIGVPELTVGVPFPPSALEVLRFAAPARYVQELTSGERIYAPAEAVSHGLVHKLAAVDDLEKVAFAEASRLAGLEREAFSLTKTMLRRPVLDRIARLQSEYGTAVLNDWLLPTTRAAIRRYVDANLKR